MRRGAGITLLLVAGMSLGGCAALPLAAIGDAVGAVSSAASGGSEVYSLGKLDDVFAADYSSCYTATNAAAGDLRLHFAREVDAREKVFHLRFIDDFGSKIDVTVQQRAQRLSQVRVDVGWFGSEPTAKLFMDRIRVHLPAGAGTAQSMRSS